MGCCPTEATSSHGGKSQSSWGKVTPSRQSAFVLTPQGFAGCLVENSGSVVPANAAALNSWQAFRGSLAQMLSDTCQATGHPEHHSTWTAFARKFSSSAYLVCKWYDKPVPSRSTKRSFCFTMLPSLPGSCKQSLPQLCTFCTAPLSLGATLTVAVTAGLFSGN